MKGDFSMVKLYDGGVYLVNGREIVTDRGGAPKQMRQNRHKGRSRTGHDCLWHSQGTQQERRHAEPAHAL